MDETQRTEEPPGDRMTGGRDDARVVTSPGDPFGARVSDREPFPSFEAALTAQDHEQKEEDGGGALNWSIDTLAEIQPLAFSPLPQQKATAGGVAGAFTPRAAAAQAFFDDEKQYSVLRTPLPGARPPRDVPVAIRRATPPTPLELHRRCRETIARCEARMRERQGKMERLQVVLPATPKRSPRHRQQQQQRRGSPPQRSTPPRPIKRSKRGIVVTPNGEMAPNTRQPRWSASPIRPVEGSRQSFDATPSALDEFPLTPSVPNDMDHTMQTQRLKPQISFGLSPITSSSPDARLERDEGGKEEKDIDEKESMAWSASGETLPSSAMKHEAVTTPSPAFSADGEKENDSLQQLQRQHGQSRDADSSWPHTVSSSSLSIASTTRSTEKPVTAASRSSIPRRQQAFMAAIEAEATSNQPSAPSRGDSTGKRPTAATSSSILALYQEAKRMGVSDPQAQWEYVQLLLPGRQKHKLKR
ncbi:hypothetical protein BBJ28_00013862 [Nothophytophthora sp. Chile5]|nr:hypothetical protein BBJ28_00013862 [Nothophytophthora sp. Chile5]